MLEQKPSHYSIIYIRIDQGQDAELRDDNRPVNTGGPTLKPIQPPQVVVRWNM